MPRTALTPAKSVSHAQTGVASAVTAAALTETAADASNFNAVANTGRELVVIRNSGGTPRTVKFYDKNSVLVSTSTTAAGKSYVFGPFRTDVWGTTLNFDCAHADCMIVVATHGRSETGTEAT